PFTWPLHDGPKANVDSDDGSDTTIGAFTWPLHDGPKANVTPMTVATPQSVGSLSGRATNVDPRREPLLRSKYNVGLQPAAPPSFESKALDEATPTNLRKLAGLRRLMVRGGCRRLAEHTPLSAATAATATHRRIVQAPKLLRDRNAASPPTARTVGSIESEEAASKAASAWESFLLEEGQKKVVMQRDTKVPNAALFIINKEDHTLGQPAHDTQLLKDPGVIFAGYKMPHDPMEFRVMIRDAFNHAISDFDLRDHRAWSRKRISDLISEIVRLEEGIKGPGLYS
uniref:RNA_pol_L_2 domain-containing protein n=1 Tax=Macrostomum lignano TaxID=282301 RepID=A0A1I8JQ09_9PLAT